MIKFISWSCCCAGAETPVWLVTEGLEKLVAEENGPSTLDDPFGLLKPGGFWADKEELVWSEV